MHGTKCANQMIVSFSLAQNNYNEHSATSKLFPLEIFPEDKFLEFGRAGQGEYNILMVLLTYYHTVPKMPSRNCSATSLSEGKHFTPISRILEKSS